MNQERVIAKLESLISGAQLAYQKLRKQGFEHREGEYLAYRSSAVNFLQSILKPNSPYLYQYSRITGFYPEGIQNGEDILKRVLDDVKGGWLLSQKGLISAEIFSDFLDMSDHLINEGYKDPAAVIIGSVLEKHLRYLCEKNEIPTTIVGANEKLNPKKANALNDDLAKKGVYNSLEHKSVTAWLALRNKAAHGHYDDYDMAQVKNMYQGVNDFIVRNVL